LGRVDAAVLDARDRRGRLARDALEVFVDVVFSARRAQALGEERARLAAVVEAARRRADAGETPVATALRLELELARVDDAVAAAAAAVDGNRRRAEAFAGGPLPPFSDRLPGARAVSPATPAAVLALEKRAESASLDEDAADRRIIPDVVVGGGPSLLNTGAPDVGVGYLLTVGVELPFFDRGQGEAARARADRAAFEAERLALVRRLDALRGDADVRATAARARSAAFAIAVERAQGLFDAAVRDLTVGAGDVVAFVDAVATLREARLQLLALQEIGARADADLSFLSGALESSPEPQ
jgi:cobalt-zinc-cadmium efflux system outer membrane protein